MGAPGHLTPERTADRKKERGRRVRPPDDARPKALQTPPYNAVAYRRRERPHAPVPTSHAQVMQMYDALMRPSHALPLYTPSPPPGMTATPAAISGGFVA